MRKVNIVIILLFLLIVSCADAASIQFIDNAGIKNGTLSVLSPANVRITDLNSTELFEAGNDTAYILDYQQSGLTTVKHESEFKFSGLRFLLTFYTNWEHFGDLCIFLLCVILLLLGVLGKL